MIITIDGPSGSGKSTAARNLARRLGFLYVNQGAFFRAVGVAAAERGIPLDDASQLTAVGRELTFSLCSATDVASTANKTGLLVDGRDRSEELLSDDAGRLASIVAVCGPLRELLLGIQRREIGQHSAVVEGRDAGSVGFPQAELKLYLDARPEVRVKRRFEELRRIGASDISVESLAKEMNIRDERDRAREVAPLQIPAGAVVLDTSEQSVDAIVESIVSLVKSISDVEKP